MDCQEFIDTVVVDGLIFTMDTHFVRIHLSRPQQANALNGIMLDNLITFLECFHRNPCRQLVIITGSGSSLCAGLDIKYLLHTKDVEDHVYEVSIKVGQLCDLLWRLPAHVFVAATGHVMGGGCGILACADTVWASSHIKIACPEYKLGLLPIQIAPYLREKIGSKEMALFFDVATFTPIEKFVDNRLVDRIDPDLDKHWQLFLTHYNKHSLSAKIKMKQLLHTSLVTSLWREEAARAFSQSWYSALEAGLLAQYH